MIKSSRNLATISIFPTTLTKKIMMRKKLILMTSLLITIVSLVLKMIWSAKASHNFIRLRRNKNLFPKKYLRSKNSKTRRTRLSTRWSKLLELSQAMLLWQESSKLSSKSLKLANNKSRRMKMLTWKRVEKTKRRRRARRMRSIKTRISLDRHLTLLST